VNKQRKTSIHNSDDTVQHLRNERFASRRRHKLMACGDGLLKVLEKAGNNA